MIVADNETAVDLLYYESIARTVVRLVNEQSGEPLSVGVHGDWGAGKSSILMMLEEAFADEEGVLCVRFNSWLYQGFEDAKAVLIETIVEELLRSRSGRKKVADNAKKVLQRVGWMKLAKKAVSYGLTTFTGVPDPETMRDLGIGASALLEKGVGALTPENMAALIDGAGEFVKEAESSSAPKQMSAFRDEFEGLLDSAEINRLVVLVDDLDRCLPQTSIETLEAIRLFLFVPRTAFVIAADEGMIEYAVRQYFPDLPVAAGPATYARNYLEKLIQVPFRLPALGYAETRIYTTLLLVLNECGEESDEFTGLAALARDVLQRPWTVSGLDRRGVEAALKSVPEPVERALDLANRIAPILVDGARGNPRQIKRFINTMQLRLAIAEERGFASDLSTTVLAKLMLAERFAPEVYDVVARGSASTGTFEELSALETAVRTGEPHGEKAAHVRQAKDEGDHREAGGLLPDWPNLQWAKEWAKIEPPLSEHDLRPYVFVTRDRRSVFGGVTARDELDELLSKLQGTALQVRQVSASVARLQPSDAEQVFDALSAKVTASEDLTKEPPGVQGLAEIGRHHEFLQSAFVSLLKQLPIAGLGTWAVSGWRGALTGDRAKSDFEALRADWADQDDNKPLKSAAQGVARVGRMRRQK